MRSLSAINATPISTGQVTKMSIGQCMESIPWRINQEWMNDFQDIIQRQDSACKVEAAVQRAFDGTTVSLKEALCKMMRPLEVILDNNVRSGLSPLPDCGLFCVRKSYYHYIDPQNKLIRTTINLCIQGHCQDPSRFSRGKLSVKGYSLSINKQNTATITKPMATILYPYSVLEHSLAELRKEYKGSRFHLESIANVRKAFRLRRPAEQLRCMSGGVPSDVFHALLMGCRRPVNVERKVLKDLISNGLAVKVYGKVNHVFEGDYRFEVITSRAGFELLKKLSARDSFKPYFDAYCSHLTSEMFDTFLMMNKDEKDKSGMVRGSGMPLPWWTKGSQKMNQFAIGDFCLP